MKSPNRRFPLAFLAAALGGCGGGGSSGESPTTSTVPVSLGTAIPALTATQTADFQAGLVAFRTDEDAEDGLGPVFNGTSCVQCHAAGAVGGAGLDLVLTRVSRIGAYQKGVYSDLPSVGGAVIQRRSLQEFDPKFPVAPEVIPAGTQFVSHRITTPLFGAGLIEAISAETILARTKTAQPDGIRGVANMVVNAETGKTEVGRFGWKSQLASLRVFAADAYLNEMGITTSIFPVENLPQGKAIPAGADPVAEPEDNAVEEFVNFMRFLAPPARIQPTPIGAERGEEIFRNMRCTSCHVPEMKTGTNTVAALSQQTVRLYSDLLLHRMGSGLNDGVQQGLAKGDQWRTAPLWGLSKRRFFLHDGRAATPMEAVLQHGGEASAARERFTNLNAQDRKDLKAFFDSL